MGGAAAGDQPLFMMQPTGGTRKEGVAGRDAHLNVPGDPGETAPLIIVTLYPIDMLHIQYM